MILHIVTFSKSGSSKLTNAEIFLQRNNIIRSFFHNLLKQWQAVFETDKKFTDFYPNLEEIRMPIIVLFRRRKAKLSLYPIENHLRRYQNYPIDSVEIWFSFMELWIDSVFLIFKFFLVPRNICVPQLSNSEEQEGDSGITGRRIEEAWISWIWFSRWMKINKFHPHTNDP